MRSHSPDALGDLHVVEPPWLTAVGHLTPFRVILYVAIQSITWCRSPSVAASTNSWRVPSACSWKRELKRSVRVVLTSVMTAARTSYLSKLTKMALLNTAQRSIAKKK
jgi:hypothetical protein